MRGSTGVSREMYMCKPRKRVFVGCVAVVVGCARTEPSGCTRVKVSSFSSSRAVGVSVVVTDSSLSEASFEGRVASCFVVSLTGRLFIVVGVSISVVLVSTVDWMR